MIWLLLVFMLVAGALLLLQHSRQQHTEQLIQQRLHASTGAAGRRKLSDHLQDMGKQSWVRRYLNTDAETQRLFTRAGWTSSSHRAIFLLSQIVLPVVLVLGAVLIEKSRNEGFSNPIVIYIIAAGIGFLLPKRILAKVASNRQNQLIDEVSIFIPLVRILFSAGLTVEQSLRILSQTGASVMPVLSSELQPLLARVDSGLSLSDEMLELAKRLEVDELSDCFAVLRQLLNQGGGAMKSLQDLKTLMDDRRLTRLQEKISKMSAKMAVVMMLFLFPALLIVLAGPGMRAISKALGGA